MPRAPKDCPKIPCGERAPCPIHRPAWKPSANHRPLPSNWPSIRKLVKRLSGGRCALCGVKAPLEVDHIIPRAKGGSDKLTNLQALCAPCHEAKGLTDKHKKGGAR